MFDIDCFFRAVIEKDAKALDDFFHKDAWVEWPCTNEHFSQAEYIRANCEYPGDWSGQIEIIEPINGGFIVAAMIWPKDKSASYHVVSFLKILDEKITSMVEYWADDETAPEWRNKMHIGTPIR